MMYAVNKIYTYHIYIYYIKLYIYIYIYIYTYKFLLKESRGKILKKYFEKVYSGRLLFGKNNQ